MNAIKKTILIGSALAVGAYGAITISESNRLSKPLDPLRIDLEDASSKDLSVDGIVAAKNKYAMDNGAMPIEWRVSPRHTPGPVAINPAKWFQPINTSAINNYMNRKGATYVADPSDLMVMQMFEQYLDSTLRAKMDREQEEWRSLQMTQNFK